MQPALKPAEDCVSGVTAVEEETGDFTDESRRRFFARHHGHVTAI